jgi:hypothetical protein
MADVYIVVYTLLGILLTLPPLLAALSLLIPCTVNRAQTRLEATPGRSFVLGGAVTAVTAIWVAVTTSTGSGAVSALGFIAALLWMGIGTLGAAGMTQLLGERITLWSAPHSRFFQLVRGAVFYELACLFPLVGWFLFAPIAGITLVGAGLFALLKWVPRREPLVVTPPAAE